MICRTPLLLEGVGREKRRWEGTHARLSAAHMHAHNEAQRRLAKWEKRRPGETPEQHTQRIAGPHDMEDRFMRQVRQERPHINALERKMDVRQQSYFDAEEKERREQPEEWAQRQERYRRQDERNRRRYERRVARATEREERREQKRQKKLGVPPQPVVTRTPAAVVQAAQRMVSVNRPKKMFPVGQVRRRG